MKRIIWLVASLLLLLGSVRAQPEEKLYAAREHIADRIADAADRIADVADQIADIGDRIGSQQVETLSREEQRRLAQRLNEYSTAADAIERARQEQVLSQFDLAPAQREELENLYKEYRDALDKSASAGPGATDTREMGNTELLRYLKEKLAAIAAAAEVKKRYVDRFAELLTAEQIRTLYNTEGQLAAQLKAAAAAVNADRPAAVGNDVVNASSIPPELSRRGKFYTIKPYGSNRPPRKIKGSKRLISQNLGYVNNYTGIRAAFNTSVTVSSAVREMTLTADDNLMDYISVVCENGCIEVKVNVSSLENTTISLVIPYSPELRELSAFGYGKIVCDKALRSSKEVRIDASGGSRITASAATSGNIRLQVSGYSRFSGDLSGSDASVIVSGGAKSSGDITASGECSIDVSGYAAYNGRVEASGVQAQISGGAQMRGSVQATTLNASVTGYAKMNGTFVTERLTAEVSGGAHFDGSFSGQSIRADVSGYARMALQPVSKRPVPVETATLNVLGGSTFSSPSLPIRECNVSVHGYAKADLYCTGTLHTSASQGTKITYDGPCTVINESPSVRRR